MRVRIKVPSALRQFTAGASEVELDVSDGSSVGDVINSLRPDYVGVRDRTVDDQGQMRAHVNVFLNDESVRDLQGLSTPVSEGDLVWILPAVSGGTA